MSLYRMACATVSHTLISSGGFALNLHLQPTSEISLKSFIYTEVTML